MSKHRIERTEQQVVLDRMADRVAELVDPFSNVESQWVPPALQTSAERETWEGTEDKPTHNPPRLVLRVSTIDHAPLLVQLLHPADDSTAGSSSAGPKSKPPTSLDGWAAHQDIQFGTQTWCRVLVGQAMPSGPAARLRRLLELAPTLDDERLHNLDADVRRWWVLARTVTTWADAPWKPAVRCSECGTLGKIQVRLRPTTAYCLACETAWDAATIDQLGTHVQRAAEHAAALEVERVIEQRPCSLCHQVHDPGVYPDAESYYVHTPPQLRGRTTPDVVGAVTA